MALIFFIYTVCVTRTNFISLLILPSLIIVFSLFASAYWNLDNGDLVMGNRLTVVSFNLSLILRSMSNRELTGRRGRFILRFNVRLLPLDCPAVLLCWFPYLPVSWRSEHSIGSRPQAKVSFDTLSATLNVCSLSDKLPGLPSILSWLLRPRPIAASSKDL